MVPIGAKAFRSQRASDGRSGEWPRGVGHRSNACHGTSWEPKKRARPRSSSAASCPSQQLWSSDERIQAVSGDKTRWTPFPVPTSPLHWRRGRVQALPVASHTSMSGTFNELISLFASDADAPPGRADQRLIETEPLAGPGTLAPSTARSIPARMSLRAEQPFRAAASWTRR